MKQISKMSIAFVAMFALASTASAQSENSGNMSENEMAAAILADTTKVLLQTFNEPEFTISTGDVVVGKNADGEDVVAHAGDTIFVVGYKYYYRNGGLRKSPAKMVGYQKKTVVTRDEAKWNELKHSSVETRFAEEMAASSGRKRDTQWYQVVSGEDTLNIVKHGNDKNHWYFAAQGDYQISEGCNGFGGTAELMYFSDSFWWAGAGAGITSNKMYELAENAGENYVSYSGRAEVGPKIDLGRRENFTIAPYVGIEATWQKTNSREFSDEYGNQYMMKSTHSNYAPVAGLMLSYRIPDSRIAFYARGEWSQKNYTYQNAEYEKHSALKFSLGFRIGLHGNYVRTK